MFKVIFFLKERAPLQGYILCLYGEKMISPHDNQVIIKCSKVEDAIIALHGTLIEKTRIRRLPIGEST